MMILMVVQFMVHLYPLLDTYDVYCVCVTCTQRTMLSPFFWRQLRDVFEVARLRYARYEHCLGELGFHAMTSQLSLQLLSKTLAANDTVFEVGSVAQEAHVKQVEKMVGGDCF